MTNKLRFGLIGLGKVGELHLEAYQELREDIEIAAAAEPDPVRLRALTTRFGLRPYSDYLEMLKTEKLDLVCVLTPAETHCKITVTCASAGVNILCEKPLAVNLNAAQLMVAACQHAGVKLFYGASYRFLPAVQKARELIQSGVIGDVLLLREQILGGRGPGSHQPIGFAHYPEGGPGGSGMGLVDHGIHLIDTFPWFLNDDVESVFGCGDISGGRAATEYMHLNFRNGAVGQLLYNDGTFPTELPHEGIFSWGEGWGAGGYVKGGTWTQDAGCIHVYGTKGALRVFYYANALFLITDRGVEQVRLVDRTCPSHFAVQLRTFVDNISHNQPPEVPGEVGLNRLFILLAAYESFRSGKLVRVPSPQEPIGAEPLPLCESTIQEKRGNKGRDSRV